jgi:hypothetical protein
MGSEWRHKGGCLAAYIAAADDVDGRVRNAAAVIDRPPSRQLPDPQRN